MILELPTESGDKVKFCRDCKHNSRNNPDEHSLGAFPECRKAPYPMSEDAGESGLIDYLVSGIKPQIFYFSCSTARKDPEGNLCGMDARLWEPKQ